MGARLIPGGPGLCQLQLVLPSGPAEGDLVALVQAWPEHERLWREAASPLGGAAARDAWLAALEDLPGGRWQIGQGYGRGHGWVDGHIEWVQGADWLQEGER